MRKPTRRDFVATSLAVPAGLAGLMASPESVAAATGGPVLDIAEWSFFWTGVERTTLPGGTSPVVIGKQMYVEYQIPAKVKHPYPIVLVHGGGGQGLDWMGTPDGRRGWATILLEEGYKVYVVDRPGHGRSPYHPDLHGGWPGPQTLESISGLFTPQRANAPAGGRGGFGNSANAKLHNQWPGTGAVGTPELTQLVASQGGSFGNGMGVIKDSQVAAWQKAGAEMARKIGPSIIMTHSAGGPFGFYVLEAEPTLVKGIVVVEGATGSAFTGQSRWGLINLPVAYDPPVTDPAQIKTKQVQPSEADAKLGIGPYNIQEEPAHKLRNWKDCAICVYTAEASFVLPNPGAVAYLKQAGVRAEEIRLADRGIHGNGHLMMGEKNNRETLKPILEWLDKNVNGRAPLPKYAPKKGDDSTAMKLADQGYFWVGQEEKKIPQGTMLVGQMFVQYLKPEQKRHRYPVVLVHGGAGQGTHYMGIGGNAGWAHYFVQAGYDTYIVDRVGHGRAIYHPDALGPIGPVFNYASITADFMRAAVQPNRRWMGTGDVGDPLIDQFQAGQNSTPTDNALAQRLWARGGGQLLDKIGPAFVMVHSAGGPFGWLIANERPGMVKAIMNVEGASPMLPGAWPLTAVPLAYDPPATDPAQFAMKEVAASDGGAAYRIQADGSVKKLKNLQGIPIAYIVAERSTRRSEPVVAFLKQAGCDAEALNLKDKGIFGNGHFMMLESNRKVVFEAIRGWLEAKVPAKA
ncbi:MAG TPA: alpha/beta fold hydrolase [Bryobacteraceae bacterium]|nr:alpha/beta fold hydrolase [Bryobacteraceae bacterium]